MQNDFKKRLKVNLYAKISSQTYLHLNILMQKYAFKFVKHEERMNGICMANPGIR